MFIFSFPNNNKTKPFFFFSFLRGENYNVVLAPTNYATGRNLSFINGCAAAVKMYISARYLVVCVYVYMYKKKKENKMFASSSGSSTANPKLVNILFLLFCF